MTVYNTSATTPYMLNPRQTTLNS